MLQLCEERSNSTTSISLVALKLNFQPFFVRPRSFAFIVRRMQTRFPQTAENRALVVEDSYPFHSRSIENQLLFPLLLHS